MNREENELSCKESSFISPGRETPHTDSSCRLTTDSPNSLHCIDQKHMDSVGIDLHCIFTGFPLDIRLYCGFKVSG